MAGHNEVMVYDFATDTVTSPYRDALAADDVKTLTEGLFELTPSGHLIVEEQNSGRLLIYGPDKSLLAQFVNRAGDGKVYELGWSRFVPRAAGDAALAAIQGGHGCG